jgi:hypothetical protein
MRPLSWFEALLLKLAVVKAVSRNTVANPRLIALGLVGAFDEINKRRRCTSPQDADEGPR